ncbi:hypothetical protein E1287_13970 [Actinomadura sp. KC06]|uniref:hypothetical protein n=1 Tax=Actinomadura sp. KC06 TaxID=2530369 RepID=UPI00104727A6|nr:hypothetical protein [Actinomadura sp. KC06]TDD35386.1 hypothetical protein E1287_13970 [Actinomadura sp. KC06]
MNLPFGSAAGVLACVTSNGSGATFAAAGTARTTPLTPSATPAITTTRTRRTPPRRPGAAV